MNRYDFQKLARVRLKDAEVLFKAGRFEGSFYLSGYVIECALKACIAKRTRRYDFPDKALPQGAYTHDLTQLVSLAKLESALRTEFVVKEWNERSRYEANGQQQAEDLLNAVNDRRHGVLKWIRKYW